MTEKFYVTSENVEIIINKISKIFIDASEREIRTFFGEWVGNDWYFVQEWFEDPTTFEDLCDNFDMWFYGEDLPF